MDEQQIKQVLRDLTALQKTPISIIQISEPISTALPLASQDTANNSIRTSDASVSSVDQPTPASLEADLAHYKELFSKLRFSYVEQVTKEKFIRAIVGDPPLIVSPQENADLERANVAAKAELKRLKTEVADMVGDLERRGRELARRHDQVRLQTVALHELPGKITPLERAISDLRAAANHPDGEDPVLSMPLAKTLEVVEQKKAEEAELDRQLEQLKAMVPRKRKEMERLQAELQPLETKRHNSAAAAKEARRRKEGALGGVEDDLEDRGRWWRSTETALKQMLEI